MATTVIDFTKTDIQIHFSYWSDEWATSERDSKQIVCLRYGVRGHLLDHEFCQLVTDGPFLTLHISEPEDGASYLERHRATYRALRDELTPSDWLEGTNEDVLILPVSTLEMVERPPNE